MDVRDNNFLTESDIERRFNGNLSYMDAKALGVEKNAKFQYHGEQASKKDVRTFASQDRSKIIKRAIAIAVGVTIAASSITFSFDKPEPEKTSYDRYVEYVQETGGTISQEGWENFAKNIDKESYDSEDVNEIGKGAR